MQGEIYQVFTDYAKLDGIIWHLAAAWRHWHEQRAAKEDCLTVLYRKLRPPFTGCFLTTQNEVWLHQVRPKTFLPSIVFRTGSNKCSGKGHRTRNSIIPSYTFPVIWERAVNTPESLCTSITMDHQIKKQLEVHLSYHDSSKNYRCDYFKSWAPSLQNLNRDEHPRLTSYYQQSSFLCHNLQENVVICKSNI